MRNFPQIIRDAALLVTQLELEEEADMTPCPARAITVCTQLDDLADDLRFLSFGLQIVAYRHRRKTRAQDAARTLPYR